MKIDPRERIVQKSTGYHQRQRDFFDNHPEFKPDFYARLAVDKQIALIDPKFLKTEEDEA